MNLASVLWRTPYHGRAAAHPLNAGAESEVMPRNAVPMVGGMLSSTLLTLVVIPAHQEPSLHAAAAVRCIKQVAE